MEEVYLIVTDITGKQYPMKLNDAKISVEDFYVTETNYNLDAIRSVLDDKKTIKFGNRIFKTEHIIEISIHKIQAGVF